MKKSLPWILTAVFALWIVGTLRSPKSTSDFDGVAFSRLPVLLDGRVQPFDSVARNSLLMLRGKQSVAVEGGGLMPARDWLVEVFFKPEQADTRKAFRIDHPEVISLLHLPPDAKYYAYAQIAPQLDELSRQVNRITEAEARKQSDPQQRTVFEKQLMKLNQVLVLYQRLKVSVRPPESQDFARELQEYRDRLATGMEAVHAKEAGKPFDQSLYDRFLRQLNRYELQSRYAYPLVVPPRSPNQGREEWHNMGIGLLEAVKGEPLHPAIGYFARMASAYGVGQAAEFNQAIQDYRSWLLEKGLVRELNKGRNEFFFNHLQPFYKSMVIYVLAFLLACVSWLNWSAVLNRSAFFLIVLAGVLHTIGLIFRMVLEGRPPVTNLYSSAIFVGWGAVVLGLILEKFSRDGVGNVIATAVGFLSLIVAHNLALSGDTMQMLRAVLDTNFWLATHVVTITIGYSAMFVAGFLAVLYILRGLLTRSLGQTTRASLSRMVYGIICFATLFSFIGTVLGGIWADQSWGRFWGWDPKENGALLIVLWCAVLLHARWGRLVNERAFMALTVFGNVVTSFSWFGVNMLGVGLHSYGFMDQAFLWLMLFVASQMAVIGLGLLPERYWRSLRSSAPEQFSC
jgi:ABC-type transport system involved in cytochrome c biogenesis permease subunit